MFKGLSLLRSEGPRDSATGAPAVASGTEVEEQPDKEVEKRHQKHEGK
jgi:hypothetical protein